MVIESPATNSFANCQHLRSALRVGDTGEHTVGVREVLHYHHRLFIARRGEPDEVVSAINEGRSFTVERPMPDALALHMGIKPKHSRWRRRWRVAQIDAVTVGIAPKAELETRNLPLREGFHRVGSLANTARDGLRTRPESRRQATFAGEGSDDRIQRGICEQA